MSTVTAQARVLPIATAFALTALIPAALASGNTAQPKDAPEPIVVHVDDRGFRWGDAGIGASAGFGFALVLAGSLALTGRRDRRVDHLASDREDPPREPLRTYEHRSTEDRRDSP